MAPTLASNAFLSSTTPHSRLTLKSPRLAAVAKRAGPFFQLGKAKDDPSSSGSGQDEGSGNSKPFSLDFGKVPDVRSLIPVSSNPAARLSFGIQRRKDPSTVFVAGATGQAGVRIAQVLLREGFTVRAGVPELSAAQELALLAAKYKIISKEELKRLNAVESAFQDAESIAKAIGNASKVVVTIGPAENGPAAEVSTADALQVIQAADLAGVGHVAIVYNGNAEGGSTNNVLDGITSFFNNLFSKSQPLSISEFLQKLIETDVSYTFIKTSLAEDFSPESSYNVVVSAEGSTTSTNDYKVAKSRIASLVAAVFSNTSVAENKVVEVFADPEAPSRSVDELFSLIPEDGRRKLYAESLAKAKGEEEALAAAQQAREAAEATKKLEEDVQKAGAAGESVENLLTRAKGIGASFSWENIGSQISTAVQKTTTTTTSEIPKVRIATVRGQAAARSLPKQKAAVKSNPKPLAGSKPKKEAPKTEVRKVFGGMFKQETIYMDDD